MAFLNRCKANLQRLLLVLTALLVTGCSSPFFYPDQWIRLTPDKLGLAYQDVTLNTADGTMVHAWHLLPETGPKGVILVLHGNAENISTHIHSVAWLADAGYELLLLDYRGFGQSQGAASLPDVFLDIEAAARWLEQRGHNQQIPAFWLGQSIGASLSSYYLSNHAVAGLKGVILDTPFPSYRRLGREKMSEFWLTWPFQYPISWMIDDRFSPERTASQWPDVPLLVFSSRNDMIIPTAHPRAFIRQLPERTQQNLEFIETERPHIGTFQSPEHRQAALRFFEKNH